MFRYLRYLLYFLALMMFFACTDYSSEAADWQAAENALFTRWAKEVGPNNVLPEYPRPQLVRDDWMNLNGLWDYAILPREADRVNKFDGKILVPFPLESALSGVKRSLDDNSRLWYRRTVKLPSNWREKRILLNFGAVDWEATVWINGDKIGVHRGGYDAFTLDITNALRDTDEQEIVLAVWDPTETGHQPRGKQTRDPHGFWNTAVSGIWQTVWLEPVEKERGYIKSVRLTPDIDNKTISIKTLLSGITEKTRVTARASDGDMEVGIFTGMPGEDIVLTIPDTKLWSPEYPYLYGLDISLVQDGDIIDQVSSYFGMRKISKMKDERGRWRLALNNQVYFQFGMLDQGWWPDGLYRAPTDEALKYDIKAAKSLNFNMLRKHGKMEPHRWYYWCDKLGILVWQDMTPGDISGEYGTDRSPESATQFETEYAEMLDELYNFPSIVTWVIFNEGWGQYDTERLVHWTKEKDKQRLVIGASGFVDKASGDIHDVHAYPGPTGAALEKNRATTLGEFGGLGFPVKGHLWDETKAWGYINYKDVEELTDAYQELIEKLHPYVAEGISAAIYTQVSDVENEVNGMLTYDRAEIKMDADRLRKIADRLYSIRSDSFNIEPILPTSQKSRQRWQYTFNKPSDDWLQLEFDARGWRTGSGGFGDPKDSNPVIGTEWKNRELWLRKKFNFNGSTEDLYLQVYHQFELESHIYVNGELIAEGPEHSNAYTFIKLDDKAKSLLKSDNNLLAVYCKNNGRRAYFDCGLVTIKRNIR